jgi:glycosyltransferase involved in cell wall biosynthesis
MNIAFIWQGITGRYGQWKDGLWLAMKHIEEKHNVSYHEPQDDIPSNTDFVLYWEAPVTIMGKDAPNYRRVKDLPFKKALLFAGGTIQKEWVDGFDHVFVESKINKEEMDRLGIPNSTAFGINEEIFYPKQIQKTYDGIHHGTCASWKRQQLVGEALAGTGIVVGRGQETDQYPFRRCREMGCTVLDEQTPETVCELINKSHCLVQTSDFWGGGQRATLEAMACNVPVICMTDSPKNREYVEESGYGVVVEPDANKIRSAVDSIKMSPPKPIGRDYILSKWTSKHYAENILKAI